MGMGWDWDGTEMGLGWDGNGMGWEWDGDGDGTGMGMGWDGTGIGWDGMGVGLGGMQWDRDEMGWDETGMGMEMSAVPVPRWVLCCGRAGCRVPGAGCRRGASGAVGAGGHPAVPGPRDPGREPGPAGVGPGAAASRRLRPGAAPLGDPLPLPGPQSR